MKPLAALALSLLVAGGACAHEVHPAYLQLRQTGAETYDLLWKVPALGEDRRLDPKKDSLEFVRGMIGSYPNFFIDVHEDDVPAFLELLDTFDGKEESWRKFYRYGINRADDRFWDTYDWFQKRFDQDEPVRGGLLDLNRYFHRAD